MQNPEEPIRRNFTRPSSESGRDIQKREKEWIKQEIKRAHMGYSD